MNFQKIFPQDVVSKLTSDAKTGTSVEKYLQSTPFAQDLPALEAPSIPAPIGLSAKVNPDNHFETAIALWEAFQTLNPLEVADRGLWTYLTHVDLWDYMRKRFKLDGCSAEDLNKKICQHWFLNSQSQAALMEHPLAGFWLAVKLSIEPERGDQKYELTKILFRNLDLPTRTLGTYWLGRLPAAVKGILRYIQTHPDDFQNFYEAKVRAITKYFNSMGGALMLGYFGEDFYTKELDENRDKWINARR